MKKIIRLLIAFLFCSFLFAISVKGQTTIVANAGNITATTSTILADTWEDVGNVSVSLSAGNKVLVLGTIESQVTSGNSNITCEYRLSNGSLLTGTESSPSIYRYVATKAYTDYGMSAIGYIFTYSAATASANFYLQHAKQEPGSNKDFTTKAVLVAMVINDANVSLPNSIKTTGDVATASTTFVEVTGTKTDAITLTKTGAIYLSASFSTLGSGTLTANYVLRYSTDGTNFTEIPNASISRTNSTNPGAATISILLENQAAATYYFDVAHKTSTGTLTTRNLSLCALGLTDASGKVFPTFKSTGQSASTTSTSFVDAASSVVTSVNGSNKLFIHSTFNMSSGATAVTPSAFQLAITGTPATFTSYPLQRYIPSSSTGSGGIVGLATGLSTYTDYTIKLQHHSSSTGPDLTTSNINLIGFQLTNSPTLTWDAGASTSDWNTANNWDPDRVPTESNLVTIPDLATDPVIAHDVDADCYDLTISSGASLTIESNTSGTGSLIIHGAVTGDATVQRYLSDDMWHCVTPVTTGVTVNDFHWNQSPSSWVLTHDESQSDEASWSYLIPLSTPLNVGQGYMVWLDNTKSNETASMTGNLQSADLAPTLAWTDVDHGFNLIGNPYACAIDYDFGTWGTNTTGFVYVWDNAYNSGDYRVSGTTLTDNIIPEGQGFFVDATSAGSFTIPAAARVHSTQAFYKSGNNTGSANQHIRIQLDGNGYGNTVFVGFPENGTDGMDYRGDARKIYSSDESPQLFAIENNIELCVNSNEPLTEGESKTVPLHLIQIVDGEYSLTISDLDQLEYNSIMLEDVKTGITQDLRANPVYLFAASSNDAPERFLLYFKNSPFGLGQELEQASNIQIYSYDNQVCIRSAEEAINQDGTVSIYDMMGRVLIQQSLEKGELVRIPLNITNNYVVVKVVKEGSLKTEMLFIK